MPAFELREYIPKTDPHQCRYGRGVRRTTTQSHNIALVFSRVDTGLDN